MGSPMSVPIGDHFTKVTDGNYHVVRVTRNGAAATLQVDNNEVIRKDPSSEYSKSSNVANIYLIVYTNIFDFQRHNREDVQPFYNCTMVFKKPKWFSL